jgi:hypothetical protein
VNRNVKRERRGLVIVEEEKKGSDPDSEDSALYSETKNNEKPSSTSILSLDQAPAPGNDHSKSMIH